ncbi:hypothetical protein BDP27DRAFT_1378668 [Rhodocollybia butyracea]|uniref:Uncharacterized protein n=1 Tax=Rhodocollybia butyracea TaxID=206335 RepID=A0A9P5P481_9AGAR|nr:hypothetical protein BDP27DRAFT_1378668 [Rhodocollybia butyracea]
MSHSTPSPNAEQRPNRFEDSTSTDVIQPNELGNHSSARATSQPPRSSSASSNPNYLPSPTATASRSPWSQPNPTQKTSADISARDTLHAEFRCPKAIAAPLSLESLLEDAAFDNAGEDDDVDAMIGRLRPSVGPFDEYSDSPVYARKGVGFSAGSSVGGAGRYSVGGGRLPPSLSSSLSPSQLPGTHPLISPSPRSSTSSSLASHMMTRDDVRGRTYATDPSRSRSQSLATSTVGRGPTTGVGAAGMYGLPTHGYTRDTSGLGSTMASWNGNDSDHTFSILRERLDSSSRRSQYLYNEYGEYDYGDKDNSNQSPFLRDVDRMLPSGTSPVPRGIGLRNSLSRGYSSGAGGAGGFGGRYGGSELDDIPGSGATSRRHSVSVVQPVRRGSGLEDLAGSAVDDEFEYDYDYAHSQGRLGMSIGGGGGMAGMGRTISMSGGVSGTGRGSLMLSDDDLLDAGPPIPGMNQMSGGMHPMDALNNNFGMMNLNQSLYQHQQQQQSLDIPQQRRGSVSPEVFRVMVDYRDRVLGTITRIPLRLSARARNTHLSSMLLRPRPRSDSTGWQLVLAMRLEPERRLNLKGERRLRWDEEWGFRHRHIIRLNHSNKGRYPWVVEGYRMRARAVLVPCWIWRMEQELHTVIYHSNNPILTISHTSIHIRSTANTSSSPAAATATARSRKRPWARLIQECVPNQSRDLVIVEADRGRDLGRIVNDNISVEEVEAWLDAGRSSSGQLLDSSQQQPWGESPMPTPISPTECTLVYLPLRRLALRLRLEERVVGRRRSTRNRFMGKLGREASVLAAKMSDEMKALQLCQSKELVRELFRLYKTRIWMASLQGGGGFEQ